MALQNGDDLLYSSFLRKFNNSLNYFINENSPQLKLFVIFVENRVYEECFLRHIRLSAQLYSLGILPHHSQLLQI